MSRCRSCDQPIDWVKTVNGKNMPVEGGYIYYEDLSEGEVIVTDGGNTYKKQEGKNFPNVKGRISHFSVCPNADDWRKG